MRFYLTPEWIEEHGIRGKHLIPPGAAHAGEANEIEAGQSNPTDCVVASSKGDPQGPLIETFFTITVNAIIILVVIGPHVVRKMRSLFNKNKKPSTPGSDVYEKEK